MLSFVNIIYLSKSNTLVLKSTGMTVSLILNIKILCMDWSDLSQVVDSCNIFQISPLILLSFIKLQRMDFRNNKIHMEAMPLKFYINIITLKNPEKLPQQSKHDS